MKIALFGATGNLGLILQNRLISEGHQVRALVHDKVPDDRVGSIYVKGNALKYKDVLKTVESCEAVVDVLGGDEKSTIRSRAARFIVKAMQTQQIKRIISMGGSGILAVGPWHFEQLPVFPKNKKAVSKDHERVHQILLSSGLEWTQICPSFMTNGPAIGKYKVRVGHPFLLWKQTIRLPDVANFIAKELVENQYINKQVALIN